MVRMAALLILVLCGNSTALADGRDGWYWLSQGSLVADNWSTAYAIDHNPCAEETGPILRPLLGKRPTHAGLLAVTGLELWANDWVNRTLHGWLRKSVDGWNFGFRVFVVKNNVSIGDQGCR